MLYFDRIDVSEGIDINKTSASKECDTCHYWYFLYKGFKFQRYVCNACHYVLMMSMNLSDIVILNINGADYLEAINLMQNIDLSEKIGTLLKYKHLFSHIKMGNEILTFGDIFYMSYFFKDVDINNGLVSNKISSGGKNYKYLA